MSESTPVAERDFYTLHELAALADITEMRLRTVLKEGGIPEAHKAPSLDSLTPSWRIPKSAAEAYLTARANGVRAPRQSGEGKFWRVFLTHEQKATLEANGFKVEEAYKYKQSPEAREKAKVREADKRRALRAELLAKLNA